MQSFENFENRQQDEDQTMTTLRTTDNTTATTVTPPTTTTTTTMASPTMMVLSAADRAKLRRRPQLVTFQSSHMDERGTINAPGQSKNVKKKKKSSSSGTNSIVAHAATAATSTFNNKNSKRKLENSWNGPDVLPVGSVLAIESVWNRFEECTVVGHTTKRTRLHFVVSSDQDGMADSATFDLDTRRFIILSDRKKTTMMTSSSSLPRTTAAAATTTATTITKIQIMNPTLKIKNNPSQKEVKSIRRLPQKGDRVRSLWDDGNHYEGFVEDVVASTTHGPITFVRYDDGDEVWSILVDEIDFCIYTTTSPASFPSGRFVSIWDDKNNNSNNNDRTHNDNKTSLTTTTTMTEDQEGLLSSSPSFHQKSSGYLNDLSFRMWKTDEYDSNDKKIHATYPNTVPFAVSSEDNTNNDSNSNNDNNNRLQHTMMMKDEPDSWDFIPATISSSHSGGGDDRGDGNKVPPKKTWMKSFSAIDHFSTMTSTTTTTTSVPATAMSDQEMASSSNYLRTSDQVQFPHGLKQVSSDEQHDQQQQQQQCDTKGLHGTIMMTGHDSCHPKTKKRQKRAPMNRMCQRRRPSDVKIPPGHKHKGS